MNSLKRLLTVTFLFALIFFVTGCVGGASYKIRKNYPQEGVHFMCACASDDAVIEIIGKGRTEATFSGIMGATTGKQFLNDGIATQQLWVAPHSTDGNSSFGKISVRHDYERPAPPSLFREMKPGTGFPAIQDMNVNILVTIEALGDIKLRNVKTGTLRSEPIESLPPKNTKYTLLFPMDLERVDNPGRVVARIVSYTVNVNPSR